MKFHKKFERTYSLYDLLKSRRSITFHRMYVVQRVMVSTSNENHSALIKEVSVNTGVPYLQSTNITGTECEKLYLTIEFLFKAG